MLLTVLVAEMLVQIEGREATVPALVEEGRVQNVPILEAVAGAALREGHGLREREGGKEGRK